VVRCVRLHGLGRGGSRDLALDLWSAVCESWALAVELVVADGVVQGLTSGARSRVARPWWSRRLVAGLRVVVAWLLRVRKPGRRPRAKDADVEGRHRQLWL
jgi:hypothetical protein